MPAFASCDFTACASSTEVEYSPVDTIVSMVTPLDLPALAR